MNVTRNLSILSEKNVADILMFLIPGRRKENEFTQIVSNYYSINSILSRLVEAKLIAMVPEDGRYKIRWYSLTPLGLEVATDLKRANDRILGVLPVQEDNFSPPQEQGSGMKREHSKEHRIGEV
ncbi:hypothetical protein TALC_00365 [Thermoplasmatales archaeon BRNA1]|nr:hypothetical protein TALC_00365 [Thermoplasmatales archaeon BRNA1]